LFHFYFHFFWQRSIPRHSHWMPRTLWIGLFHGGPSHQGDRRPQGHGSDGIQYHVNVHEGICSPYTHSICSSRTTFTLPGKGNANGVARTNQPRNSRIPADPCRFFASCVHHRQLPVLCRRGPKSGGHAEDGVGRKIEELKN